MIRDAVAADAARCAAIYAPYVRETAISFEERAAVGRRRWPGGSPRRSARTPGWCWSRTARSSGYAYGGPFMSRAAYQWATAVSVYLAPGRRRTGAGRALYEALFERLAARGHRTALAGIALPNEASVGLHRRAGLRAVGTYRRVGWKLGRWHDVAWYQRALADDDGPPAAAPLTARAVTSVTQCVAGPSVALVPFRRLGRRSASMRVEPGSRSPGSGPASWAGTSAQTISLDGLVAAPDQTPSRIPWARGAGAARLALGDPRANDADKVANEWLMRPRGRVRDALGTCSARSASDSDEDWTMCWGADRRTRRRCSC